MSSSAAPISMPMEPPISVPISWLNAVLPVTVTVTPGGGFESRTRSLTESRSEYWADWERPGSSETAEMVMVRDGR